MLLCNFDANCSLGEIRIDQAVLPMDQKARPERLLGAYYIQPNSGYIRPDTCFAQGYQQNKPQYPRRNYLPDSDSQAQVRQASCNPYAYRRISGTITVLEPVDTILTT